MSTRKPRTISAPTPYKLVKNPLPVDAFKKTTTVPRSHFKDALIALAAAPRGTVLQFEKTHCEKQVKKAATALGYKVLFAVKEDTLLVQLIDTGEDK